MLTCAHGCSLTYFMLYCNPTARWLWISITFLCNTTGIVGNFFPAWRTPKFRPFRTGAYVISGSMCCAPLLHILLWKGVSAFPNMFDVEFYAYVLVCVFYVVGVLFYVLRIPERFLRISILRF
jgi:adiponectin receptor